MIILVGKEKLSECRCKSRIVARERGESVDLGIRLHPVKHGVQYMASSNSIVCQAKAQEESILIRTS